MMKLLRNPEVRKDLLLYGGLSILGVAVAYWQSPRFGLCTLILCILFIAGYLWSAYTRCRRIANLAAEINRLLHSDSAINLEQYTEGELGILQSEIYKMTVRLREQQQSLLADKLYLADSLADISHQIRTPLTSINLLVQFLSEPEIPEERRYLLCHELYELLSRIEWLITALLKISKLDAGTVRFKRETVSLKELIDRACAPLLVPMELREQELSIEGSGTFEGDIAWTCEALGNIVKNCIEYTPDGGEIRIYAEENPLYTEIRIADSGSGIAKEDLPHIFERFYKGKDSDDKNFGIGLALSRMIIVGQNGTVKAESRQERGTVFTVRFYKGII